MSETAGQYEARQTGDAMRAEREAARAAATELLRVIADLNYPARGRAFWLAALAQAVERIGEAV